MSAPASKTRWLIAFFIAPLLVLAGVAVAGLRAREAAALERARELARTTIPLRADAMARTIEELAGEFRSYPSPPWPGPPAPAIDVLDRGDDAALLALAGDPDAGLSPAGLPRRVLAALRLHDRGAPLPPERLLALALREEPSVLTPHAITSTRARDPGAADAAMSRWREMEIARRHARRAGDKAWIAGDGGWWWFASVDPVVRYFSPSAWQSAAAEAAKSLPAGLEPRLRAGERGLAGPETGEVLAATGIGVADGLVLEILATDRGVLLADSRREQRWSMALVALAMVVPSIAAFFLFSNLRRERELARLKSQFVASVSHELRAPVGSIRLMAEALHQGKVGGPAAGEFHALIASEGARLSHLVENVLDVARIEDGRKSYRFEECDLTRLVLDAVRIIEPLAAERGIRIEPRIAEVTATVDPHAIQQAAVNLLDNAVKFSPTGATVEVELASDASDRWSLAIRDHGPGIPRAEHERIFERFHRLGNELRREARGTGIGLSIVKHVAIAHGGMVHLASEPGRGSTFTLTALLQPKPPP